jgi:hypothetical protein
MEGDGDLPGEGSKSYATVKAVLFAMTVIPLLRRRRKEDRSSRPAQAKSLRDPHLNQ